MYRISFITLSLILLILLLVKPEEGQNNAEALSERTQGKKVSIFSTVKKKKKSKTSVKHLPQLPDAKPVGEMEADFKRFLKDANNINSGAERAKVFEVWRNEPETLHWFETILSRPQEYQTQLDDTGLAMARVYGIKFMEYLADQGEKQIVVTTIQNVVDDLQKPSDSRLKARDRDLADLLAVYLRSFNEVELKSKVSLIAILKELEVHKVVQEDLKQILDDELYVALYPIVGKREASQLLDEVYPHI